ncbi:hypothetical protein A2706_02860 [Candidatus Peribacteria bacterium RIFCSPHIGHO2_01_FULL_51_35]|nr:MAG: hypothetical protein A2706_02860 [Candidatus Peribacteria bacterium RIFCSPHIGHO2_01_FULL_51_35]
MATHMVVLDGSAFPAIIASKTFSNTPFIFSVSVPLAASDATALSKASFLAAAAATLFSAAAAASSAAFLAAAKASSAAFAAAVFLTTSSSAVAKAFLEAS